MSAKTMILPMALLSSACWGAWDTPAQKPVVANAAEVERYLEQRYPQAGHLRLRYQSQSKLGSHYHFDVWVEGQYQPQRTLVASVDNDQQIYQVFRSLEDTHFNSGKPVVASELEHPRSLVAEVPPTDGQKVSLSLNLLTPDLRTMNREAAPEDLYKDLDAYPGVPWYLPLSVEGQTSDGKIYLNNDRVTQVDIHQLMIPAQDGQPAQPDSSGAFLPKEGLVTFANAQEASSTKMTDLQFPQLMAFYHLDLSTSYLDRLGYDLFPNKVRFDARAQSADNSSYLPDADVLAFGIGGSPDALDGDVVLHEFGHAINYHIVPDWAYGHTQAIGEGFGDYWAGSYSYRIQFAEGHDFELDTVFNWDGYFGFKKHTRSLNNQRARYFEQADYLAHFSVGGELGDELWSAPLFQALKDGVALYGEQAFDEMDTIVLESLFAVGRGVKMHDLAEQTVSVAESLYPQRQHATHLRARFAHHGLLSPAFSLQADSPYVAADKELTTTLVTGRRPASVSGELRVEGGDSIAVDSGPFERLALSLPLPAGAACGAPLPVTADLDYRYGEALAPEHLTLSQALIKGVPQLSGPTQEYGAILPDAKRGGNGLDSTGFKVFTYLLNGAKGQVDDSFAVALNIDHDSLQDLKVTLVSPLGTRVDLLNHHQPLSSRFETVLALSRTPSLQPLLGESLAGAWRLEVTDYVSGDQGRLNSLALGSITGYQCSEPAGSGSSGGTLPWQTLLLLVFPLLRKRICKSAKKK